MVYHSGTIALTNSFCGIDHSTVTVGGFAGPTQIPYGTDAATNTAGATDIHVATVTSGPTVTVVQYRGTSQVSTTGKAARIPVLRISIGLGAVVVPVAAGVVGFVVRRRKLKQLARQPGRIYTARVELPGNGAVGPRSDLCEREKWGSGPDRRRVHLRRYKEIYFIGSRIETVGLYCVHTSVQLYGLDGPLSVALVPWLAHSVRPPLAVHPSLYSTVNSQRRIIMYRQLSLLHNQLETSVFLSGPTITTANTLVPTSVHDVRVKSIEPTKEGRPEAERKTSYLARLYTDQLNVRDSVADRKLKVEET